MKLRSPLLWFAVAAAALLGALWYRSRQAVAARAAQADQQRETVRLTNWRLPWEENVTSELSALRDIATALQTKP